jgi:hypothetical protein
MKEEHKALVARPAAAVGAGKALSQIVSDALVLARFHATSVASARFRVGNYEFREADFHTVYCRSKANEIQ